METIVTDVLVIGAGGSAARAAVEAAGSGVKVDLVNKGKFGQSGTSTPCLQGFASTINEEDSPERFFADWLRSSGNICDQNLVWEAIMQSQKAVKSLEAMGMEFLTNPDGSRQFYRGAGHSVARGMTAKYHRPEGPNTVTLLRAEAEKRGVRIHEGIMITTLLLNDNRVVGAVGIDNKRKFFVFNAKAVVLAAGGANNIFPNTATEAAKFEFRTTGDSFWLAFNAGVPLVDLEFTQFRESPPGAAKFGGRYLNALGERFMEKYDPQALEKAPRAKVVASIYREMMEGRGPIKWEVAGIPEEEAKNVGWVKQAIEQKWVPVGIDFQRLLGGARINEKAETRVSSLFAAGESSGGVQGAGRMQGAAYLETQVFGTIAGKNAAELAKNRKLNEINAAQLHDEEKRISNVKGDIDPARVKQNIQNTMWEKVGVVRKAADLKSAIMTFRELKKESAPKLKGDDIFAALEATNLLFTAEIVTASALAREESRGAHNRSDYPGQDDKKWLKHVCITNKGGGIDVSTVPVVTIKK